MEEIKAISNEANAAQHTPERCPACGSDQMWRIQRSEAEKIASYLSHHEFAIKKYRCRACQGIVLIHQKHIQYIKPESEPVQNNMVAFVACRRCDSEKLHIDEVLPPDEIAYREATGKTAFRKLTCLNCNDETMISHEDYSAANQYNFD